MQQRNFQLSTFTFQLLMVFLLVNCLFPHITQAQYFGRNKVQYQKFNFKELQTPHYTIYNYITNDTTLYRFADMGERWYQRHQLLLKDTLKAKNPIMIYNNHADFQQTTLSSENISIGTGGITEGFKNRVFMPFFESNMQTEHVLGHELVHAFQYNILKHTDSISLYNIQNIPLWMVEGMAEYLSIGHKDAHTAMWMRDAVISKNFPNLRDLTITNKYFPYRYGQAFWAFVAGQWGDSIVKPLFINTAKFGYQMAVDSTLGYEEKVLSNMWKNNTIDNYKPFMNDTIAVVGTKLLAGKDMSNLTISPHLSPNGKYVTLFSERNLFSIDLFLANTETGQIIRKISSQTEKFHVDQYNFIEDIGSWSPDGSKYMYTVFSKGKNVLVIVDTQHGDRNKEVHIPGLPYFNHPAWSPNGEQILVNSLVNGKPDLFLYHLKTRQLRRLTNDYHSEIQGAWSKDGRKIVFASDRGSDTDLKKQQYGAFKTCILDIETNAMEVLDIFPGANNLDAHFSYDAKKVYFLSNADGFRNLYEYNLETKETLKLTKYFTGISGVTELAPAISVAGPNDLIAYSIFKQGKYHLYKAKASEFPRFKTNPQQVDFTASLLPPFTPNANNILTKNLNNLSIPVQQHSYKPLRYKPKFSLTNVSQAGGIGVGASQYGTMLSGGVSALFGDILDRNQVLGTASINGEVYDFGAAVQYLNRAGRFNWGLGLSHVPFLNSFVGNALLDANHNTPASGTAPKLITYDFYKFRTFIENISGFVALPFSQTLRIETSLGFSRYAYRVDRIRTYYEALPYTLDKKTYYQPGAYAGQDKQNLNAANQFGYRPISVMEASVAYVGDNTAFGLTAPVKGQRFRFEVGKTLGDVTTTNIRNDYRHYFFNKPFTIAVRGMYYGRFGNDKNRLYPLYLGYDEFVRGYNINSMYYHQDPNGQSLNVNDLIGSQLAIATLEFRLPFSGPKKLALIKSGFLLSDLVVFADAGKVWGNGSMGQFNLLNPIISDMTNTNKPPTNKARFTKPIYSAGLSLRINLFGFAVLEPYVAYPFQRFDPRPYFGFFISGGGW